MITIIDVLEHVPDPVDFMARVHRALAPGGVVIMVTPLIDSLGARLLRSPWSPYLPEHLCYFSRRSISGLLARVEMTAVSFEIARKYLTYDYIQGYFMRYHRTAFKHLLRAGSGLLPAPMRRWPCPLPSTESLVVIQASQRSPS